MLKQAILFEEQLKNKYIEAICDEHFKFYSGQSYKDFRFEIFKDDWNAIQRVSVDTKGNIIGFVSAEFNRDNRNVTGFGLINFTKQSSMIFAKDILKFMRELRDNYNANKFEFSAYRNSPADLMYREFISKHGGNIVGIKHRNQKLCDGKYYDSTIFEILREDMKF